ncbi:Pentatricopeptide repeat-containing protein [Striga hermonthica]|uniref:Pentatricopeptide repeat-containing protein n=1 Tax=Striga hermonthica TaxID=68872 RepID=A0A9N7NU81_STRHE|nr:Pentatricopeptide repeat-containing protein [Striga hermonthica]
MLAKDSVTWVAIISGLSQNGRHVEAILLYSEMRKLGVYPTPYVFSSIISACTKINSFELGGQFHALIIKWGFSSELFVCNSLVTHYSRSGNLSSAELIFDGMSHKDKVTFNTLISGFATHGSNEKSLELFDKMQTESLKPDCVTVASLFGICASMGDLCKGTQLHAYAVKEGMCLDVIIEGSLLNLYVKCSDIKAANRFFLETQNNNVVLWNVMLVAYGQMGELQESVRIYSNMLIAGLQPNEHTYPNILRTCTSAGALDLGEQVHTQVIKTGFQPNVYVCSVLIDMYAKHGELEPALKIFRRLKEEDVVSWTAMISGYAQHDMFHEAIKLFEEMQAREIRSDNIGLASVISACAGIQALDQGRQIHSQSIVSGYSSDVSIGNALACLYARCGRTREADSAFERINPKDNISWNGFISGLGQSGNSEDALKDRGSLWSESELGQKDPTELVHSEKLAVAFGLMSLPGVIPLHVMKNLRVCNDCHNWIKFISRVSDRAIVVRDAYSEAFLSTADSAVKLLPEATKPVSRWKGVEYRTACPVTIPSVLSHRIWIKRLVPCRLLPLCTFWLGGSSRGALLMHPDGTFSVDFEKVEDAVESLSRKILTIQRKGDKNAAKSLLSKHGVLSQPLKSALDKLQDIEVPVDILPDFPIANNILQEQE